MKYTEHKIVQVTLQLAPAFRPKYAIFLNGTRETIKTFVEGNPKVYVFAIYTCPPDDVPDFSDLRSVEFGGPAQIGSPEWSLGTRIVTPWWLPDTPELAENVMRYVNAALKVDVSSEPECIHSDLKEKPE
jgi:hypothetical protein